MRKLILIPFLICFVFFGFGQESESKKKDVSESYYLNNLDRKWMLELPLWVPGFRGQFAFGDISMSSTEESDDERERFTSELGLEFYFVGRAQYEIEKWMFSADAFSGRINSKIKFDRIIKNEQIDVLDITIHGTIPRIYAGYTLYRREFKKKDRPEESRQWLKLIGYIGMRYVDLSMSSVVLDSVYAGSVRPRYVEPIIGLYASWGVKRWFVSLSGDIGAIDNKASFMINTQVQYRFGRLVHMKLGWNHLGLRHEKEYNGKNLNVDIILTGPALGVGFRF